MLIEEDALVFKIDVLDRLIGRKGFRIERNRIKEWRTLESSSLLRKLPSIEICTDRGCYLIMFPKGGSEPPEERLGSLISWLEAPKDSSDASGGP